MFHCLVIKVCCVCLSDSSFILSHLFLFVKHFFKFFSNIFELRFCCRFAYDLDTLSYLLSFVNCEFHFSEILFNCLFFENNYLRQLSYNTTVSTVWQEVFAKKSGFLQKSRFLRKNSPSLLTQTAPSEMGPLAVRKSFRLKCKACGTPEAPSLRELAKPSGFD